MNKSYYFLIAMFLILNGCATKSTSKDEKTADKKSKPVSSEKKINELPSKGNDSILVKDIRDSDASDNSSAPSAISAAKPVESSLYQKLDIAIKEQSDEKIYQSATDILSQNSEDHRALNAIGLYHYKKGRLSLAKSLLLKALSKTQSSDLYSNLAIIELSLGEKDEAIRSLRKALEISSQDATASANLGALYVQEKDFNKARLVLETAYRQGVREPRVLNNYAIALTANQQYDKAAEIYQSVLKDQNNNKEVLFNYAILLIDHMGKFTEGLEVVNRLKFVGGPAESRNKINALENKAKAGLK
ncbi:MAG: tetratricopeptide repeat protein [Pseudobdellovibrionaceae bacterium]